MKTDIEHLISICGAAGLDGYADFLAKLDSSTVAREYNGIGPEWAGPAIRDKVTKYLGIFEPAAVIHDLRNYKSDGTAEKFHLANAEFHRNCRKLVARAYSWWEWRRYRGYAVAHLLLDFVDGPGGWAAWTECYEENKKNENENEKE